MGDYLGNYHSDGNMEKIDKSALFQTSKQHSAELTFINNAQWFVINNCQAFSLLMQTNNL